jgi:hypothetical protein
MYTINTPEISLWPDSMWALDCLSFPPGPKELIVNWWYTTVDPVYLGAEVCIGILT